MWQKFRKESHKFMKRMDSIISPWNIIKKQQKTTVSNKTAAAITILVCWKLSILVFIKPMWIMLSWLKFCKLLPKSTFRISSLHQVPRNSTSEQFFCSWPMMMRLGPPKQWRNISTMILLSIRLVSRSSVLLWSKVWRRKIFSCFQMNVTNSMRSFP